MKIFILIGIWIVLGFVHSTRAQTVTPEQRKSASEVLAMLTV